MLACEAGDPGSIPGESTKKGKVSAFPFVFSSEQTILLTTGIEKLFYVFENPHFQKREKVYCSCKERFLARAQERKRCIYASFLILVLARAIF